MCCFIFNEFLRKRYIMKFYAARKVLHLIQFIFIQTKFFCSCPTYIRRKLEMWWVCLHILNSNWKWDFGAWAEKWSLLIHSVSLRSRLSSWKLRIFSKEHLNNFFSQYSYPIKMVVLFSYFAIERLVGAIYRENTLKQTRG